MVTHPSPSTGFVREGQRDRAIYEPMSYRELRDRIRIEHGRLPSAIRISVGVATNFADAYRFLCFLQGFVDRSVAEINQPTFTADPRHAVRVAA